MANFPAPAAYPYALKDPFPSADANSLIEAILKTHNADDGSAHQPTGTSDWSGGSGFGWAFADAFPFSGELDVTDGLLFTSATSGLVQFGALVPVRVYNTLTIKASIGGLVIEHGASETVHGTLALSSDSTVNVFTAGFNVKSAGAIAFENGSTLSGTSGAFAQWSGEFDISGSGGLLSFVGASHLTGGASAEGGWAGVFAFTGSAALTIEGTRTFSTASGVASTFNGDVTFNKDPVAASSKVYKLDPARNWTRRAGRIAGTSYDTNPLAIVGIYQANSPGTVLTIVSGLMASGLVAVFEFDLPPDGGTISEVKVNAIGGSVGSDLTAVPTYRVIRWQEGIDAAPEDMSVTTGDAHTGGQANWTTEVETTIAITAHATIDTSYRYGVVMVTPPHITGTTAALFLNVTATGTIDRVTGR